MEGKTHYIGGAVGALAGYQFMRSSGALLPSEVLSPTLQLLVIYSAGLYGAQWCDIDHHIDSSPLKDPISLVMNKILHFANPHYKALDKTLTGKQKRDSLGYKWYKFLRCVHRSWQTHSEFTLILLYILYNLPNFVDGVMTGYIDMTLLRLIVTGLTFGVLSHIILDLFTVEGIPTAVGTFISIFYPRIPVLKRLRLVPKSGIFVTGSRYEKIVRSLLFYVQFVLLAVVISDLLGFSLLDVWRDLTHNIQYKIN